MTTPARQFIVSALAALMLAVAGCAKPFGGSDEPSRFYVLTPEPTQSSAAAPAVAARGPIVGVSRVALSDHLKREEIVTRSAGNQVVVADLDRWAAELESHITTVLAQNLSAMIPSDRVVALPSARGIPLDYRVQVNIANFEQGSDGAVELNASWQVFKGEEYQLLGIRKSNISEPVSGEGYDAIVGTMSQALAELSRQIATQIQ